MSIKTHYPVRADDPNQFRMISDSDEAVTTNFTSKELYNPKAGLPEHPLALQVVYAVQIVRDYYGFAIRVNSTYRNYIPKDGVAPATISPHMMAMAIDFSFLVDKQTAQDLYMSMRDDFNNKGELFQLLWSAGVRGFGIYDTFVHIDVVVPELYPVFLKKRGTKYNGLHYAYWNKMKILRYKSPSKSYGRAGQYVEVEQSIEVIQTAEEAAGAVMGYVSEFFEAEDRGQDFTQGSMLYLVSTLLTILILIIVPFAILSKSKN